MNFVGSIPTTKTAFENFMFSNFNANVDLSESSTFVAVVVVIGGFLAWKKLYNVTKYSR